MNKKFLVFILGILLAVTLVACSENENANAPNETDNQPEQTEQTPEPQPEPEPEPEPQPEPEPEPEKPSTPEPSTDPKNIALASNGTTVEVDSLFSGYSKDPVNDGFRLADHLGAHDLAWASSLEGDNHWVEFTFPEAKTPYTMNITWAEKNLPSQELHIQVMQDGEWVTIQTWSTEEETMEMAEIVIENPVETEKLRLFQEKDKGPVGYSDPNIMWIGEVEIYEPDQPLPSRDPLNVALASNGTTVVVDSTMGSYKQDTINDGYRVEEFLTWSEVAWASELNGQDHWIEFTFPEEKTPAKLDIYWSEQNLPSQELQLQVEQDGEWKTIQVWSTEETKILNSVIEIEEPVATQKFRLFQEKDKGPIEYKDPNIFWVSEVEIYE